MILFDIAMDILVDEISGNLIPTEEEIENTVDSWLTDLLKEISGGKTLVDAYIEDFEKLLEKLEEMEIKVEYDCYFSDWWGWLEEMARESF